MASSGKIEIEKFNDQSFELWKLNMEDLFMDKDQWIAVDPGEATTKALWDKLGTLYQSKSLVNKLFLQKKLYNLRMKDGDSVTEHLNAFNTVVSQLASVDIKISDEDKCINLLCSLLDSWDSLVITVGSNATALQFDEIVLALLTEQMRWKNMESQNGDALSKYGVAERMNKTSMERERSKLSGVGLGQEFWVEAVETACYLVNRLPSSTYEDKAPQEDGLEGYKLWNPVTRKVLYSRDVMFREVKYVIENEVQPKEPEKIEFELKEEESDSTTEEESEDEEPQTPGVRRSMRERRQPERYSSSAFCSSFALSITDDDPRTVKEAVDSEDGKLWNEAMVDEMASLHKNEAWDMVELLVARKPIGNKWLFKKKTMAEGKVEKYKARLVVKGYSQVSGIDFGAIFSPITKVTSIRLLLFVVVAFDFEVE
eukprot:PITA_08404